MPLGAALLLSACLLVSSPPARADDIWSSIAPGIDHLHRTTADPQDYHVVLVELGRPEIWLRATGPGENGQRTSSFAAAVGATVAINGDLWDADNWSAYEPLGLAVGDGWQWRDDTDVWSFLACDLSKQCQVDDWGHLAAPSTRWHNAIGGMQDLLVIDGVPQYYEPAYYSQRNPRTATGLTQDGGTLILLVADGRRTGALGMTFADLTNVMMEFGAYRAVNHDGGGSSTLVIGGAVRNVPSDGSERIVANHLAILVADHTDPACVGVENSRQCVDETQMRTCTGGLDRGIGDCGYFGLTCEQEGLFAYCVDPRCVHGGQANLCLDPTRIGMCTDGVYSEGDCAGYGLPCVEGFGTAWCWADFYQAEPVTSSLGAPTGGELTARTGEPPQVWFELRNTGLASWTPGGTLLAPLPRDQNSPLAATDWIAGHRIATVESEVPPGEVGRFAFTLSATDPGDHSLDLGLVQEGVTWFADPPGGGGPSDGTLTLVLHVVDATPTDGGVPDDPDAGGEDPVSRNGCGCGSDPAAGSGAPGLLLALVPWLVVLGRRRRPARAAPRRDQPHGEDGHARSPRTDGAA